MISSSLPSCLHCVNPTSKQAIQHKGTMKTPLESGSRVCFNSRYGILHTYNSKCYAGAWLRGQGGIRAPAGEERGSVEPHGTGQGDSTHLCIDDRNGCHTDDVLYLAVALEDVDRLAVSHEDRTDGFGSSQA
jgi:hypothetical protein